MHMIRAGGPRLFSWKARARQQWRSLVQVSSTCDSALLDTFISWKHRLPYFPRLQLTMTAHQILPEGFQEDLQRSHAVRNPTQPTETTMSGYTPPQGFMEGPAPNIIREDINFAEAGLPEYDGAWAVVLDGVMTEEECKQLVEAAEATTDGIWERAMVNVGGGRQAMYEDTRKCGRIIWDNREIMTKLWARIEGFVPDIHRLRNWASVTGNGPVKWNETWRVTRLNERGRYLKYVGGEYFKGTRDGYNIVYTANMVAEHCDGTYETPDRTERSYFTLHLYLNDAFAQNGQRLLEGGATTFHGYKTEKRIDVVPRCGRVLLFQHRDLLHSGDDVVSGTKMTLRTDLMYELEEGVKRVA